MSKTTTNQKDTTMNAMTATVSLSQPQTCQGAQPIRHRGLDFIGVSRAYGYDAATTADRWTQELVGFNPTPERLSLLELVEEALAGIHSLVSATIPVTWDRSVQDVEANFQEGVERTGTQMDAYVRAFLRVTIGKAAMASIAPCDFQRMVQVWVLAWGLGSSFPTLAGYECAGFAGCDEVQATHARACQDINASLWDSARTRFSR